MRIDAYAAPLMVTWQLTRDCDLACLHCCTDSAPGRLLPDELDRREALALARQLVDAHVPYVMLVGGEPTRAAWFYEAAESLGRGGVFLKIETNGQSGLDVERLKPLGIRSIQISLDGATPETYARQRPGGSLEKALETCRAVVAAGLPLEVTFAPTRLNIDEASAVVDLALSLGAFRFNTGRLMRVGTAAKLWGRLEPSSQEYDLFLRMLEARERELAGRLELCFRPFSVREEAVERAVEPAGTLLVLPDGKVKVSAALPFLCADLRRMTLSEAWKAYRAAWDHPKVREGLSRVATDEAAMAEANRWTFLDDLPVSLV